MTLICIVSNSKLFYPLTIYRKTISRKIWEIHTYYEGKVSNDRVPFSQESISLHIFRSTYSSGSSSYIDPCVNISNAYTSFLGNYFRRLTHLVWYFSCTWVVFWRVCYPGCSTLFSHHRNYSNSVYCTVSLVEDMGREEEKNFC